jgi:tetratricopeptide (TPR) repeat protein
MLAKPSAPFQTRTWLLLLLLVVSLGVLGVVLAGPPPADHVLIMTPSVEGEARDLGSGLEILLSDCMEVLAGATVTHAPVMPPREVLERLPADTRLLRFRGSREGGNLALNLEWNTTSRLLADQPWTADNALPQVPRKAFEQVIQNWPLAIRHEHLDQLVPVSPDRFWRLMEGLAIQDDLAAVKHLAASQALAEEEPSCATAWAALGDHLYRSLWVNPDQAGIGLNSRTHHAFEKAVRLIPGHPRATFLWSLMLTDTGNQNVALQVLRDGIQLRPGSSDLYLGVAYAGRTSGLLDLARRALARRTELLRPIASPSAWFAETTYLYLGDLKGFADDLARTGSARQDASILFYKGYVALLQGNPTLALGFMRLGCAPGLAPAPFRDLCSAYRAFLEGRPQAGLMELREIDKIRGRLRIPDGEWTFKEAEIYSLLGDGDRGVDCATRAFVQGFSCAEWYEGSPFLARVRTHPRWPTLRRNIRERQAVLAGTFPPSAFGL